MVTPNSQNKSVLGKGLASLLPPKPEAPKSEVMSKTVAEAMPTARPNVNQDEAPGKNRDRHPGIMVASVDQIKANEFQPRRDFDQKAIEELAQSIRENGLIQPLVVRKSGDEFELIAGERRLRASRLAGLKMVPVVIRKSTDREALELAIVENIQREDLNCVDEGLAYFQLMQEFQLSQEELAKRMGKERATIANALRILKLSDTILSQLKSGKLTRGHAKALLSIEDVAEREKFAGEILEKNLSVRQAEQNAKDRKTESASSGKSGDSTAVASAKKINPELQRLTQDLTRHYMTKVEIKGSPRSGEIRFRYGSKDELYRLLGDLLEKNS